MFGIDDALIGAGVSAGADIIGGLGANSANRSMTHEQDEFARDEAQKQRDWEEHMSSTAYQRQMADMEAAGLNPIMAANKGGGASTPSGATANPAGASPQQSITQGASNTAMNVLTRVAELKNLTANTDKINSDTALNKALSLSAIQDAKLKTNNARVAAAQAKLSESQIPGAKIESDIDSGTFGKIMRYLDRGGSFFNSALGAARLFAR